MEKLKEEIKNVGSVQLNENTVVIEDFQGMKVYHIEHFEMFVEKFIELKKKKNDAITHSTGFEGI